MKNFHLLLFSILPFFCFSQTNTYGIDVNVSCDKSCGEVTVTYNNIRSEFVGEPICHLNASMDLNVTLTFEDSNGDNVSIMQYLNPSRGGSPSWGFFLGGGMSEPSLTYTYELPPGSYINVDMEIVGNAYCSGPVDEYTLEGSLITCEGSSYYSSTFDTDLQSDVATTNEALDLEVLGFEISLYSIGCFRSGTLYYVLVNWAWPNTNEYTILWDGVAQITSGCICDGEMHTVTVIHNETECEESIEFQDKGCGKDSDVSSALVGSIDELEMKGREYLYSEITQNSFDHKATNYRVYNLSGAFIGSYNNKADVDRLETGLYILLSLDKNQIYKTEKYFVTN